MAMSRKAAWQEVIRNSHHDIVQSLYPDHVIDRLVSEGIISYAILDEITSSKTRHQKVRTILERVRVLGENDIQLFILSLQEDEGELYRNLLEEADKFGLLINGQLPIAARDERGYYTPDQPLPYPTRVASEMSNLNTMSSSSLTSSEMSVASSNCSEETFRKDFSK